MLPLLLRVATSLFASWHLTPPSPARVVAAIVAGGGTVVAIAALLAPSTPSPRASGAAAEPPVEAARPATDDDPNVYLGWAHVPEWRPLRPKIDDRPRRRRRHIRIAPDRRSPAVAERRTAEPLRPPPPTDPAPEGKSHRRPGQPAAPPSPLPTVEFAFASPHVTGSGARAAAPEEAPSPAPDIDVSPEPAPPSEPTPPDAEAPASPTTTAQHPPTQPPATARPAPDALAPRMNKPRNPIPAPPVTPDPVAASPIITFLGVAPVLGTPGSPAWPSAPSTIYGPAATPGQLVTPLPVMAPLMFDRVFGSGFGNGIDDIVVTTAKGAGPGLVDLFKGPRGPSDGRGGADGLVDALLADDFDPGLGKAFDISAPAETIATNFDVPASSSGNSFTFSISTQGDGEPHTKTILRPMTIGMVPEPGTAPLLALGLAALAQRARRKVRR